jgi:streptogramin lyase
VITEFSTGLDPGATIGAITAGADGHVWFVKGGTGGQAIGKIDPTGVVTTYTGFQGSLPLLGGITLGPDGNVWFTDYFQGLVGFITPGGVITEIAGPTPNSALNAITTGSRAGGAKVLWFTEPNPNLIGEVTIP